MKRLAICIVLLFVPTLLLGQTGKLDTEGAVRQAWAHARNGYTSTVQKELGRLGDASAIALMKIIGGRPLEETDVDPILLIVALSYSDPRIVETESDRQPRATLFLLSYLVQVATDAKLKEKIGGTQEYVRDQYAKSVRQESITPAH